MSGEETTEPGLLTDDDEATAVIAGEEGPFPGPGPAGVVEEIEAALHSRYRIDVELGHGGMGTVVAAFDKVLQRDIAIKKVREDRLDVDGILPLLIAEARTQGRLDHPVVVPVYDLGVDADGRPFFTMQSVQGVTLKDLLARRKQQGADASTGGELGVRRLLSAFTRICLAVDFAHSRGVLHGDLKPGNLMFGSYGEVYVLDWGGSRTLATSTGMDLFGSSPPIGSPQYMAPELLVGDRTPRKQSDVFALGVTLYETLTGERAVRERLAEVDHPSVPPELLIAIRRAVAPEPDDRYPTARALAEVVEAFLDGARDEERRRQLSREHTEAAEALLHERDPALPKRREAIGEIGRALALDPSNAKAFSVLLDLIDNPPVEDPQEVEVQMHEFHQATRVRTARLAASVYFAVLLTAPFFLLTTVHTTSPMIVYYVMMALAGALAWRASAGGGETPVLLSLLATAIGLAATTRLFGSMLVMPMFAAVNIGAFTLFVRGRSLLLTVATGVALITLPVAAELLDLVPASYRFVDGAMVVTSGVMVLDQTTTTFILVFMNLATMAASLGYVYLGSTNNRAIQRKMFMQTWHFRQLVPPDVSTAPQASRSGRGAWQGTTA